MKLTPWFPPGVEPMRDGVYLTSQARQWGTLRSGCWHAFRWDCQARAWFSAESTGRHPTDLIGADKRNRKWFFWRGILKEPSRSQRMREAGFTRRPSAKSLPSDE